MTIFTSDTFQDNYNKIYPHKVEALSLEELAEAVRHDNVCVEFKNYHRRKENFLRSDVLPMDIDNGEHKEKSEEIPPESWITPTDIEKIFPDVCFYIVHSKNSGKDKDREKCHDKNWTARPRFHVLFPLEEDVTDESIYSRMKQRARDVCPYFDNNAKDSGRYYDAVDDPKVEFHTGDLYLDEFLASIPDVKKKPSAAPKTALSYPETDKDELIDALYHIDCANLSRHDWIIVGMALKAERIPCDVWDAWSQTDSTRYHAGECERKWSSFTGSGVTAGTIFMMARDAGWRPKPKRSKALSWNSEIGDGDDPMMMGYDDVIRVDSVSESDSQVKQQPDKEDDEVKSEPATATSETEEITPPAVSKTEEATPPKRVPPVPDDFSELGLAEWFVAKHGDDYRYNDSHGVLHYNEATGCWDEDSHAMQMEVIRDLDDLRAFAKLKKDNANYNMEHCVVVDPIEHDKELTKFGDDLQYAEELEKFVGKMRSANRIKGVCDLVIPHIVISSDKLDRNPYILNTPDGLIDLRTGKISPHSRAAYCTKCTKIGPSNVGINTWYQFIDTVTVGDASLAGFLQLVVGMCLIGTTKIEKVIFLIGGGANGKSTFTGAVMNVLGDYATAIDSEVLMNTRKNVMPAMATLRSKRMALASELAENRRIDTGQLKKLSSTDLITAERKYFAPETFRPSHTLILQSNYLPRVDALDKGTWRRICAIPFFATIDANEAIENYAEVLFEKAGGAIMQWAIEGAVNFTRNNYKLDPIPEAVEKTTSEYQTASNWIEIFLTECTESNGDSPAHDVYQKYAQWALARGEHPRSETSFGTAMRAAGHGSEHTRSGSVYYGIKVSIDD